MLESLIRSTNYQGNISINFETTKTKLMVTTRDGLVDFFHELGPVVWILYYIFGMWLMLISFDSRDSRNKHAEIGWQSYAVIYLVLWFIGLIL